MANSPPRGKQPQKPAADSNKVGKILAEARKVVDALGVKGEAAPPSSKKSKAASHIGSSSPRALAETGKKPALRGKAPVTPKTKTPPPPSPPPAVTSPEKAATPSPPPPRPLSPQECGILVTHALPGRVRLRVKSLKFNRELAHDLETRLLAIHGVDGVEASPATGSLLISYRSRQEVAPPLGKALQTWFPRLDTESLLVEMLA